MTEQLDETDADNPFGRRSYPEPSSGMGGGPAVLQRGTRVDTCLLWGNRTSAFPGTRRPFSSAGRQRRPRMNFLSGSSESPRANVGRSATSVSAAPSRLVSAVFHWAMRGRSGSPSDVVVGLPISVCPTVSLSLSFSHTLSLSLSLTKVWKSHPSFAQETPAPPPLGQRQPVRV